MIRHLLLDADGVVQDLPGGWRAALEPFLGERSEEFVTDLAMDEQACLRGEPFLPVLADRLARFEVEAPAAEVYAAAWERIAADPAVLALADRLRARGLGVHLATNQNPERASYMRRELGYGDRFDTQFYSCELGVAKPEAAYFQRILATVGCHRRAGAVRRRLGPQRRRRPGRPGWPPSSGTSTTGCRGCTSCSPRTALALKPSRRRRRGWPDWRP